METPVLHIPVLPQALRAHPELLHAGARTVIRHLLNNGIAGAAVRAIGKRVMIPSGGGVAHLLQALRTRGQVRQHHRNAAGSRIAFHNAELFKPAGSHTVCSTPYTRACSGKVSISAAKKRSGAPGFPSTWISTPDSVLRTNPFNPCRTAKRYTWGRKPTPGRCRLSQTSTPQRPVQWW